MSFIQRPHIVRDEDGRGIDEKIATFFVDKALRAIADDIARDNGVGNMIAGPKPSLGNLKGQQRYIKRVEQHAKGRATIYLGSRLGKKTFGMLWDRLRIDDNNRLVVRRIFLRSERHCDPNVKSYDLLSISRHALIRSVQRIQIRSVEDVFHYLTVIWGGAMVLMSCIVSLKLETPGTNCWLVPVPFGKDAWIGLLIGRPVVDDLPALVTVYPHYMLPDDLIALGPDMHRALHDEMPKAERDPIIISLLAQVLR